MHQDYGYILLQKLGDGPHFYKKVYKRYIDADKDGYVKDKFLGVRTIRYTNYLPGKDTYLSDV